MSIVYLHSTLCYCSCANYYAGKDSTILLQTEPNQAFTLAAWIKKKLLDFPSAVSEFISMRVLVLLGAFLAFVVVVVFIHSCQCWYWTWQFIVTEKQTEHLAVQRPQ